MLDEAFEALSWALIDGEAPFATLDPEHINALSAYNHALRKDTPAKRWWNLDATHAATARALRINPQDDGAAYALIPFRLARTPEGPRILVAHPCPRFFAPQDPDWLGIETVLSWEPNSNTVQVEGDPSPRLVGAWRDDATTLFNDPRAFFQAWAQRRAQFAIQREVYSGKSWHTAPAECDLAPGQLIVGDASKVRWNPAAMPEHVECVGIDPRVVNKAVLRAAHLPRLTAGQPLRAVA